MLQCYRIVVVFTQQQNTFCSRQYLLKEKKHNAEQAYIREILKERTSTKKQNRKGVISDFVIPFFTVLDY